LVITVIVVIAVIVMITVMVIAVLVMIAVIGDDVDDVGGVADDALAAWRASAFNIASSMTVEASAGCQRPVARSKRRDCWCRVLGRAGFTFASRC
jgi:hypothetical protein